MTAYYNIHRPIYLSMPVNRRFSCFVNSNDHVAPLVCWRIKIYLFRRRNHEFSFLIIQYWFGCVKLVACLCGWCNPSCMPARPAICLASAVRYHFYLLTLTLPLSSCLRIYRTDLYRIFFKMVENDEWSNPIFLITQGMLPWRPILVQNRRNRPTTPSFVALAFRNGLVYCSDGGHINSSDDPTTLYKHSVNCGPETPPPRIYDVKMCKLTAGVDHYEH